MKCFGCVRPSAGQGAYGGPSLQLGGVHHNASIFPINAALSKQRIIGIHPKSCAISSIKHLFWTQCSRLKYPHIPSPSSPPGTVIGKFPFKCAVKHQTFYWVQTPVGVIRLYPVLEGPVGPCMVVSSHQSSAGVRNRPHAERPFLLVGYIGSYHVNLR